MSASSQCKPMRYTLSDAGVFFSNHKPKANQRDGSFGLLLAYVWCAYVCKPKVTMFAVEMWFGVGDGVECGRSTGLCPLPLGVPRCVIHNKKNVGTKFLVILKNNNINHQNHSNNAKKQKNFQMTKHLHRDLSTTNQKNRPFGL